jgi:hypothetical protein
MTDENKYKLVGPAPDLFASSSQIEEQINEKVPEEEEVETFEASVGDTVKGMGAEVSIALAGNASGAALAPFTFGISYPVASFIGGFGGSVAAQEIEGQPKFQVGRALFAGFANLIPAGNTLKAGANVSKLAYAGRVVRTGGVGSAVTVADTTAQAIIDEHRLPTLKELGFSAAVGFAFGSTIDLATIKVAPTATKVWDKFTDKTKKLFLQMSGKTEDEINEALAQKLITREEVRHFKDLLVNEQYKDAGFVEGFLGNKVIDLNDIPLADRQGYIKDRLAYLDDLTEELTDQFSDGEIGSDIYTTKNKEWNTERQALRERQNEIAQSVREVINEDGSFNIDESQSSEVSELQPEINVTETTQGETQPLEVTVGGEKIPSDVPVTPKDRVTSKELVQVLSDKGQQLDAGLGQRVDNYTTADGVEVTLKDGGDTDALLELNGVQVQGDVTLDVISNVDGRGAGKASKELDRILAEADSRDMSVDLEIDPEGATLAGEEKGLNAQELKKWYERKGFIFEGEGGRGYRPRKSEDVNSFKSQTHQIDENQVEEILTQIATQKNGDPFDTPFSHSDPETMLEAHAKGELEDGYHDSGNGLYYIDGANRPQKVDNAEFISDYSGDSSDSIKITKPKPDAEATPAPVTPEVAPEAAPSKAEDFVNLVDSLLKGDRSRLKGVKGTNEVARLFDDYKNRLNTVIEGLKTGHSTLEEASALLDELVTVAPKKYELDNVDGSSMAVRRADREPENFQEIMTEESAEIVADIERLRDNLNFQKDVGENFENLDALRKRILGDVEDVPVIETPNAKPKKPTAVPEDKVDTPKPTARQARIAKLEEETNLLHALVSGEDISQIDGVAGIHPSLKPKGGNTDVPTYEQFLKKRKAELIKAAKELQKAEINVVKDRILNPAIYKRHWIDKALDLNFLARTSSGLSAPTSMTAGVFSAAVNIAITPIRNMLGSSLWKGMTLKNKSLVRKALYAGSDLAAYQDAFMTIFNRSAYKDFGKALINRGKNPLFSDGDVRFKEGYNSDGAGNARELATQRKQLKRNENQQGLKNTFARIKALDSAAEVAMELINLPYTVIGAVDVPFTLAMITGKLRAEGLRAGIDQEVPDLAKFVDEYIEAAFKEQNGKRVWAYKQHYEKIRQQADDGLFKNRKLEDDDIRKTFTESILDIASKHTTQGTVGGRLLQVLMWVITTPSIAVTKGTKFALSPMLEPLRHVGKATATLAPNSEFNIRANKIMGQDKASFKTLRSDIKNLKEALDTAVSSKQKAIIEKELIQKNDSLKVVETRLEKNKARMAEMDSESLGNALMATGMYVMFWNMSEKDMVTGGGHWMNDDQRRDSTFQPYMMLRDNGTGGHDYRMGEPYRIVISIIADVQKWHQYKEEGLLTEDQLDLSAMMARTIRGILQDSPFTGGVKNVMRVLSPTSAQETRKEVVLEMALGAVPGVPNIVKAPIRAQQQYFDDRSQTKGLGDRVYQNLAAAPAPNLKRDEYGRPKERNKKSLANAVFRTAKQEFPSSLLREQKLDEILEQDNRLGNIIGPISSSYKTHDMKGYWKNGKTIYEDFQVFMLTFENSNGLTMMDESLEIIESDGWEESYNNGRLGSLNALEEMEDIDDAYDENGNLKGGISKDSNEGLEKIRDAKRATIEEAKKEFFTAERVEQYQNRDGDNPAQALMQQQQFEKNWGWMPQN